MAAALPASVTDEPRSTRQWNDFGSLFRGRGELPDELLQPGPTTTTCTQAAKGKQSPGRGELSPSKRRNSEGEEQDAGQEEQDDGGERDAADSGRAASVEREVEQQLERPKARSPQRKRAPAAVRVPSPELGDPEVEVDADEEQPPVASSSKVPAGPKGVVKPVKPPKPLAVLKKPPSKPTLASTKRAAPVLDSQEDDSEAPVAGPSNAAKRSVGLP